MPKKTILAQDTSSKDDQPLAKSRVKRTNKTPKHLANYETDMNMKDVEVAEFVLVQFVEDMKYKVCSSDEVKVEGSDGMFVMAKWDTQWYKARPVQVNKNRLSLEAQRESLQKAAKGASSILFNRTRPSKAKTMELDLVAQLNEDPTDIDGDQDLVGNDSRGDEEARDDVNNLDKDTGLQNDGKDVMNEEEQAMEIDVNSDDGSVSDISASNCAALQKENGKLQALVDKLKREIENIKKEKDELFDSNISLFANLEETNQKIDALQAQQAPPQQVPPQAPEVGTNEPPAPGFVTLEVAARFNMVELAPLSGVFAYQGVLDRLKNKKKKPTQMARALLRMCVEDIESYQSLKDVPKPIVQAAIDFTVAHFLERPVAKTDTELRKDLRNVFTCNKTLRKYQETGNYPESLTKKP